MRLLLDQGLPRTTALHLQHYRFCAVGFCRATIERTHGTEKHAVATNPVSFLKGLLTGGQADVYTRGRSHFRGPHLHPSQHRQSRAAEAQRPREVPG